MDQHQKAEQLANRRSSLTAVGDARVVRSSRMEPQEVSVARHQDTPRRGGEFEVSSVIGGGQSCVRRGSHIDIAPAKTGRDAGGDMLVKWKRIGTGQDASSSRAWRSLASTKEG